MLVDNSAVRFKNIVAGKTLLLLFRFLDGIASLSRSSTWILMDLGLFSHDQEGMGRNMGYNNVFGSSIFLLAA